MDTVRSWVEEGVFEDASLVVVGEPTHLQVAVASKGLVWVRLTARGARGHASTPRGDGGRGPSGPERLVEALANLPARPVRAMHPRVGEATLAVSGLESDPTPFNVLAGEAQARLDVRFPPPKMPQDVVRSLRSHLDLPVEGLEMGFEKREPAFLGEEATGRWARSVLSDAGVDSELVGVDFVSEAGHWQRLTDTLILGPGSISRAHRPDEYIERGELKEGVGAYSALVEAGAPA